MVHLQHNNKRPSSLHAKQIILIASIVTIGIWMMQPLTKNNNIVLPHHYFNYGMKCLQNFSQETNQHNYKLMNTYAKNISKTKDVVLIQAKNLKNSEQIQIECNYTNKKLTYLETDSKTIPLK